MRGEVLRARARPPGERRRAASRRRAPTRAADGGPAWQVTSIHFSAPRATECATANGVPGARRRAGAARRRPRTTGARRRRCGGRRGRRRRPRRSRAAAPMTSCRRARRASADEGLEHPDDPARVVGLGTGDAGVDELVGAEHARGGATHEMRRVGRVPDRCFERARVGLRGLARPTIRRPRTLHDDVPHRAPAARRRRARRRCPRHAVGASGATGAAASRGCCASCWRSWASCPSRPRWSLRSAWARTWAARETERVLREQGIAARYAHGAARLAARGRADGRARGVERRRRARCSSATRARDPAQAVRAARGQARHRPGRARRAARARRRRGRQAREPRAPADSPRTEPKDRAACALQRVRADRRVDRSRRSTTCTSRRASLDLDVTADDDAAAGLELRGQRPRGTGERAPAARRRGRNDGVNDDDALCSVEGRVRIEPERDPRATLRGRRARPTSTPPPGPTPPCDLPADDKRRVELSLGSPARRAARRTAEDPRPSTGTCACALPSRWPSAPPSLPETDGWVGLDADVRYGDDTLAPGARRERSRRTTSGSRSTQLRAGAPQPVHGPATTSSRAR